MAIYDAILFLVMHMTITVVCISEKSLTFEGWVAPEPLDIILQFVNLSGHRSNTGDAFQDRRFIATVTFADDALTGTGPRPVSCNVVGTVSGTRYAFLRDGCGEGKILDQSEGFMTSGSTSVSPYFLLSGLPQDTLVQLECTFELCRSQCNRNSCEPNRGRSRRRSLTEARDRKTVTVSSNILKLEGVENVLDTGNTSHILKVEKQGAPVLSWARTKALDVDFRDRKPSFDTFVEVSNLPDAYSWIPIVLLTLLILATIVTTACACFRRKSALMYELERMPDDSGIVFCTDYECDGLCRKTCKMHECDACCCQPCKLKISNNLTRFISRYPQRKLFRNRCDSNCKSMCRAQSCSLGFKKTCNICGVDCNATCKSNTTSHHHLASVGRKTESCRNCVPVYSYCCGQNARSSPNSDISTDSTKTAGEVRHGIVSNSKDVECTASVEERDEMASTGRQTV